ncbi:MAG: hypothetical protein ACI4OL_07965 [Gemmiger sp.]
MEAKNLFLLQNTEEFMRGELDNVTISHGHIVLDNLGGSYVPYGCYTSPAVPMPLFDALRVSWNATTPQGTVVEMQARVMVDGNWCPWCSFGKWSPYIRRESPAPSTRGPLVLEPDRLLLDSKRGAQIQLRIYLYTQDERRTPAVRLLAASVRQTDVIPSGGKPVNACLRLLPYAAAERAPTLQGAMDLAVSLASLTNRWGADILPEEFAFAMYDWQPECRANLSFAAAAAGCWGFPAWVRYTDLGGLRADARAGYGAVVRLTPTAAQKEAGYPPHRYVAVRGFSDRFGGGTPTVLLDDPMAPSDFEAETEMPLDEFMVAWDNVALTIRPRLNRLPAGCPTRTMASLRRVKGGAPGLCQFYLNGTLRYLPDDFCGTPDAPTGLLAWTALDGTPHATTAHKKFHFAAPVQGGVVLPVNPDAPAKYTVYAISASGAMLVADITL